MCPHSRELVRSAQVHSGRVPSAEGREPFSSSFQEDEQRGDRLVTIFIDSPHGDPPSFLLLSGFRKPL